MGIRHGYRASAYMQSEEDRARASREPCPICEIGRLKITKVAEQPTMGVGLQEISFECDNPSCDHSEDRMHDPTGRKKSR
jgi:hypothetical protein